jgi:hypothetical protein
MDSIKPLFTAVGSVTGGRNGHGEAEDHSVSVNLSVPKAMGGFGGALDFVAVQKNEERQGRNRHLQRVDWAARRGRTRHRGEAARQGRDAPAGGARGSRPRGARENLSLLARYAEQCSGRALCRGR